MVGAYAERLLRRESGRRTARGLGPAPSVRLMSLSSKTLLGDGRILCLLNGKKQRMEVFRRQQRREERTTEAKCGQPDADQPDG